MGSHSWSVFSSPGVPNHRIYDLRILDPSRILLLHLAEPTVVDAVAAKDAA